MNALVLAALALLQQQPAAPRPDSTEITRQSFSQVSIRVAAVRSAYDQLRRAVYNAGAPGTATQRARLLERRCAALAEEAVTAGSRMCRSCFPPRLQEAFDRYRAGLPGVRQVAQRCRTAVARALRADSTGGGLRPLVPTLGRSLATGLRPYEDRVGEVRRVFNAGAAGQAAPPRRPGPGRD